VVIQIDGRHIPWDKDKRSFEAPIGYSPRQKTSTPLTIEMRGQSWPLSQGRFGNSKATLNAAQQKE